MNSKKEVFLLQKWHSVLGIKVTPKPWTLNDLSLSLLYIYFYPFWGISSRRLLILEIRKGILLGGRAYSVTKMQGGPR